MAWHHAYWCDYLPVYEQKCDEIRITAFELWCWRRVLRISWTEYKTNVWVRQKIGVPEKDGLLEQLKTPGI